MKFTLMFVILVCSMGSLAQAQTADLLISEYVEGSGDNKAIELFNGTETVVDLGDYVLERYANGATTPSVINLPAETLPHGQTFVMVYSQAEPALLALADHTDAELNFSGNDALVLRKLGTVIDSIGQVGYDPGTGWTCANGSTLNTTMRRQPVVCSGDTDADNPYDPCAGYDFLPSDTFDDLGDHFADCSSVANQTVKWDSVKALYR